VGLKMSKADPIEVAEGDEEEEVLAVLTNLDSTLSDIERHLGPLMEKLVLLKDVSAQISHLENAKLYAGLAYTLNTLFFMYLKTQGVSPATHPVKPELARVQRYIEKIQSVAQKPQPNPTKLDKGAVGRFIRAALSGEESKGKETDDKAKEIKEKERNSEREHEKGKVETAAPSARRRRGKGQAKAQDAGTDANTENKNSSKSKNKQLQPHDEKDKKRTSKGKQKDKEIESRSLKRSSPVPEKEQDKEKPKQKKRKA